MLNPLRNLCVLCASAVSPTFFKLKNEETLTARLPGLDKVCAPDLPCRRLRRRGALGVERPTAPPLQSSQAFAAGRTEGRSARQPAPMKTEMKANSRGPREVMNTFPREVMNTFLQPKKVRAVALVLSLTAALLLLAALAPTRPRAARSASTDALALSTSTDAVARSTSTDASNDAAT